MSPEQQIQEHVPLSQVLQALPDPAWLFAPDTQEYLFNQKLTDAFPVVKLNPSERVSVLHPDDREALEQQWTAGLDSERAFELQVRVLQGSNQYQRYLLQISPVVVEQRITAWLGVVRPMEGKSEMLQALLEHVPVGIALMDEHYHLKVVNPKLVEGTRYTREEYQEAHLQDLFPQTFALVKPLVDEVLTTGKALPPFEFQGRHAPEGQEPPFWQIHYFPVHGPDGRLLGVGSTTQDITARRKAEQELQASQDFLRRITEAVPAVVSLRDLKTGRTVFSNSHAAQVIGYSIEELEAMEEPEVIQLFPPEDVPATYQHYQTVPTLAEGEVLEREYRMRHRDGNWRWIYGKTTIFSRDPQGRPLTALSASLDITARKEMEMALRDSEAQLTRLMEAQKRFVSDASHEIKTPLAGIQGNLEVLLRYSDIPEEEKQEILQDCHREATRLGRLVGDLLGMARGNTDLPMMEDDVRLDQVVQDAFRELERTRGNRTMELGPVASCTVLGDQDRLKQLLVILLSNAVKYTPDGGSISLQLLEQAGHAEIRVQDTGIGIRAEDLKHVFERFYRADTTRQGMIDPGGTGLGLNIARWIVQEHQGEIWLESEPGKGTTAVVRIPLMA